MSQRRRLNHNPLQAPITGKTDVHEMDAQMYGAIEKADAGMQTAYPVSIFEIQPDPRQPRRQIPSLIRQQWNGDPRQIEALFDAWQDEFGREIGRDYGETDDIIRRVLDGEEIQASEIYQQGMDAPRNWGVAGGALLAVINLAAEIRREGLLNPITIARTPIAGAGIYLIETGERRWLAYHLLHIFTEDDWSKIPAREISAPSVWRQASENTARESLNAIGMARQLALLLMDLHGPERFQAYFEIVQPGQCDRAYYAQVADGQTWRVPRGTGEKLVTAMGIKNPVQLRQYRDLLTLPDEAWMLADDLSWTEFFIRSEILEKAVSSEGAIALAQYHADRAGYRVTEVGHTVTVVTVSADSDVAAREELASRYYDSEDGEDDDGDWYPVSDGTTEIGVGDTVKTVQTGDELYKVEAIEETRYGELYLLRNDQMPPHAEMKVQFRFLMLVESAADSISSLVAPTSSVTSDVSRIALRPLDDTSEVYPEGTSGIDRDDQQPDDSAEPKASLEYWEIQALEWAYARAQAGKPWFAAKDSPSSPERLNQLIDKKLLRGRNAYTNTDYNAAHYAISGAGCLALGKPFLSTTTAPSDLQPSRSSAAAQSASPVDGGREIAAESETSPVRRDPDPFAQQEKLERKLFAQIEEMKAQFTFNGQRIAVEQITTANGRIHANGLINQMEAELRKFRNRLNGK